MDTRPLRESPAFRRVWTGLGLSAIGSQMTSFAVVLQVYTITHSSLAVGSVGLTMAVPAIAFGLVGGSLADALDRRKLALVTSSCLAGVSALFAVQAFAGLGQVWLLYCLVAVQGLLSAVDNPARRTFLPRLLPAERIPAGAALNMLTFHISVTAGPALAGVIAAAWGLKVCYLVDALSFAASLWLALVLLAVAGVADVLSVVFRTAVVQVATPDHLRGRVSAAEYVVGAGSPQLGNFRAGAIGSLTSPAISAVSGGLATIVGATVIGLSVPALSRYRAGRIPVKP